MPHQCRICNVEHRPDLAGSVASISTRYADADTLANASGIFGVMITPPADGAAGYMAVSGYVAIRADAAPTAGNLAWLSGATSGQMMTTNPTGGNFDVRLGRVVEALVVSGVNYGVVPLNTVERIPTETDESFGTWEGAGFTSNDGNRTAQATLEGGSYIQSVRQRFNRISIFVTIYTAPSAVDILIYQAPGGTTGSSATAARRPQLIASVTAFDPGATGNFDVAFDGGAEVVLEPGIYYVLWGREVGAGNQSWRVWANTTMDLGTTNMAAGTHPVAFTSAIVGTPATIDPRNGGDLTAIGTVDTALLFRLKRI